MTGKNHTHEKPARSHEPGLDTAPDTPAKRNRQKLPPPEIAALAGEALKAWESGVRAEVVDSEGGVWSFLQERDPEARLEISRTDHDGATNSGALYGQEFGLDHDALTARLASVILAVANPA